MVRVHADEVLKSRTSKLLALLRSPVSFNIIFFNSFHFSYIYPF